MLSNLENKEFVQTRVIPKLKAAIAKSNGGLTKFHLYPEFTSESQREDNQRNRFKNLRPRGRITAKS